MAKESPKSNLPQTAPSRPAAGRAGTPAPAVRPAVAGTPTPAVPTPALPAGARGTTPPEDEGAQPNEERVPGRTHEERAASRAPEMDVPPLPYAREPAGSLEPSKEKPISADGDATSEASNEVKPGHVEMFQDAPHTPAGFNRRVVKDSEVADLERQGWRRQR